MLRRLKQVQSLYVYFYSKFKWPCWSRKLIYKLDMFHHCIIQATNQTQTWHQKDVYVLFNAVEEVNCRNQTDGLNAAENCTV